MWEISDPYEWCENCYGEGTNGDPYGFLDYDAVVPCKDCSYWKFEHQIKDEKNADAEAFHS